jgi:hypothetical protein
MSERQAPLPHFTVFRSAAEEVGRRESKTDWLDEGSHKFAESGRVVQVDHDNLKVVLTHEDGTETQQPCGSMREGEAIIRRNTPAPPKKDLSQERDERSS